MRDRLLTVPQVGEVLNVNRSYVYKLCNEGSLRTIIVGKVRGLRIYESSLNNYIANKKRERAA